MQFKVAVVQFEVEQYRPEANIARAEEHIRAAAGAAGAELVVLPEDCLTGVGPKMTDVADTDGTYRETFRRLAAKYAVDLVPGSCLEEDGGKLFNTTYYIDASGEVLARYRKVHLWLTEKPRVTPGDEAVVCDTRFGRVGLAICWDLAFPEHFREMFHQRAEIVVCPACWCLEDAGPGRRHNPNTEQLLIDSCCYARAVENEIIVIFCNVAGEWAGRKGPSTSAGHTQVAVPFVGAAAILPHNREAILLHDVDTAILAEAETSYEIKKDLLDAPENQRPSRG